MELTQILYGYGGGSRQVFHLQAEFLSKVMLSTNISRGDLLYRECNVDIWLSNVSCIRHITNWQNAFVRVNGALKTLKYWDSE